MLPVIIGSVSVSAAGPYVVILDDSARIAL